MRKYLAAFCLMLLAITWSYPASLWQQRQLALKFKAESITSRRPLFRKKSKNLFESSKILLDTWPTTPL